MVREVNGEFFEGRFIFCLFLCVFIYIKYFIDMSFRGIIRFF